MPVGPGKYDDLCTDVRVKANADGAVVIIINGRHGHGFSMQASPAATVGLPRLLRDVAKEIERSLAEGRL